MSKNKSCLYNLSPKVVNTDGLLWLFSFYVPIYWILHSSARMSISTLTFSSLASILIAFRAQASEWTSGFRTMLLLRIRLSSGSLLTRCLVEMIWLQEQTYFDFLLKVSQFLCGFVLIFPILSIPSGFPRLLSGSMRVSWQLYLPEGLF